MTTRRRAPDLDPVWRALASPIRRHMLDLLHERPRTTSELVEHFPDLSRFAVMQHLRVLEAGRLTAYKRDGRQRVNYLNSVPIQQIFDRWVKRYHQPWLETLVALKGQLETESGKKRA